MKITLCNSSLPCLNKVLLLLCWVPCGGPSSHSEGSSDTPESLNTGYPVTD